MGPGETLISEWATNREWQTWEWTDILYPLRARVTETVHLLFTDWVTRMHRNVTHWQDIQRAMREIEATGHLPTTTLTSRDSNDVITDEQTARKYAKGLASGLPAFHVSRARLLGQGLTGAWPQEAAKAQYDWYRHNQVGCTWELIRMAAMKH